jgi:hypothetical protein
MARRTSNNGAPAVSKFAVDWETRESKRDVPEVELWYPRVPGNARHIEIGLSDVRAADNIRVSYDFDRDGWVVEQAAVFEWECNDPVCDADWQEVAFIRAWARERKPVA